MATAKPVPGATSRLPAALFSSRSLLVTILRLAGLAFIDAFAIWFAARLVNDGEYILALFIAVITLGINVTFLFEGMYPYRWFTPGLSLLILMIIYPTIFTLYVAFTNYKDGNLLTRVQAEDVLLTRTFLPEDAKTYGWTAFRSLEDPNRWALWLIPTDGEGEAVFAEPGNATPAGEVDLGDNALDEGGIPTGLPGWERVPFAKTIAILDSVLAKIRFGEDESTFMLNPKNPTKQAGRFEAKYALNEDGTLYDRELGVTYKAMRGTYTPVDGPNKNAQGQVTDAEGLPVSVIRPGYYVPIGLDNFKRLIENEKIRGPFIRVFLWTFAHAFLTVFITFWFGLFLALLLNVRFTPGRAVLRTLLLVPYAMPAFISVLVWKGLLNEQLGVINKFLTSLPFIDVGPRWTSNAGWVKVAILLIQLWLGFPYICLLYTSPSPRDRTRSRMPSSA